MTEITQTYYTEKEIGEIGLAPYETDLVTQEMGNLSTGWTQLIQSDL